MKGRLILPLLLALLLGSQTWGCTARVQAPAAAAERNALSESAPEILSTPLPDASPPAPGAPRETEERSSAPATASPPETTRTDPAGPIPLPTVGPNAEPLTGTVAEENAVKTERIPGTSPVEPSLAYEPLPLQSDAALEALIMEYLGNDVDHYGIVVKRLYDGRGVAINPDREFYAASLFKLLVMYEVFKQRDDGLLSFDEVLTFTESYLDYQIGEELWPVGSEVPIGDLLYGMITVSDNVAAVMLLDRVGGWNVIADLKSIGLEHTDINSEDLPTTAGDMAIWLEMIAKGRAVSQDTSQEMISLLAQQVINDRLPARLPEGICVAHKTGNWDNATHDAGVVYASSGPYVIAVLSDWNDYPDPIAELSQLVYDYFEQNPAAAAGSDVTCN